MAGALLKVPQLNNPGTAMAAVRFAKSQVGYREGPNNWTIYGVLYGMNNTAWCNIFTWWSVWASGGGKLVPKSAYTPASADWFKGKHQFHTGGPQFGDWVFFYHASMGRIGHVGMVVDPGDGHTFTTVEGNSSNTGSRTGDGVYQLKRKLSDIGTEHGAGFGRPLYVAHHAA